MALQYHPIQKVGYVAESGGGTELSKAKWRKSVCNIFVMSCCALEVLMATRNNYDELPQQGTESQLGIPASRSCLVVEVEHILESSLI